MIRRCANLLLLTLRSSSLPAQNAEATTRDEAAMKEQIIAQMATFMHAWEKRDAVAMAATTVQPQREFDQARRKVCRRFLRDL